jgi:predicted AlkP superfamily phosphohydrolase/phosphomutase
VRLPRWTTYPALAVLAGFLVTAVPFRAGSPHRGAAKAVRESIEATGSAAGAKLTTQPRTIVLGIDGLDPDILSALIREHPERVPHFKALAEEGSGVRELGTSTPPQSPVAWSNFITGLDPGGHGIFDFIHRNPATYTVAASTVTSSEGSTLPLPGVWEFPVGGGGGSNRTGEAFWTILGEHGVPADVWRMPINFPVEGGKGWSFSGMMTPAIDSAYGEFTFYSTDLPASLLGNDKMIQVPEYNGVIRTTLYGPENSFKEMDETTGTRPRATVPMTIYVDHENGGAAIELADHVLVLRPGEWSDFTEVSFDLLPAGLMGMSGIVRFYLRSIDPAFELYASPINVDPKDPYNPVSAPEDASERVADTIGDYYTQGMPEDVNSLKRKVLTDAEFMEQVALVHQESERMLDYALERYLSNEEGGLLFFYYSTIDLCCHMMWRHADEAHPFHDAKLAAEDSSWFTGRAGSTWGDEIVDDLYAKMDEVLGHIRARAGEETRIIVMSDHGFAPYHRKFDLNTWLLENGYLVLKEGKTKELPVGSSDYSPVNIATAADWSRSRAYGIGFNALYLNLAGREGHGIVQPGADADALLAELKQKLEAFCDDDAHHGERVVLHADLAKDVYSSARIAEAPDILVGYNSGYGDSDEAAQGYVTHDVLSDNLGGTFNGSHLMDPRVVAGTLLTNARVANASPRLEDLTVEILRIYGIQPAPGMKGQPVFE